MADQLLPYKNSSLPIAERVEDLLTRMTLEEKIGQLSQIFIIPENREEAKVLIRKGQLGSRILTGNALGGTAREKTPEIADLNEIQHVAVDESRLGIPLIHGRDIIHGHRTVFPIPLAMAATWDSELTRGAYAIAAKEAASTGVHWSFSPMLDIARDPRWGRIIEGFGEDPYLAAKMAAASVKGLQGDKPNSPTPLLACAKHYVGYGAAEGGRDYNTAEISDTTLRNIYLPSFKAAVDAGCASVMSAFHDLNGESASGSHYLLTEILKEEFGFNGFIVSDWESVRELVNHRMAADKMDAAHIAFNAGVDMEMVSRCFAESMLKLVERGLVSLERLNDAVRRILTAKFKIGLFEHPYTEQGLAEKIQFTLEHRAYARQVAANGMVLLQNNFGRLPLSKALKHIAVIGPLARQRSALLGSWVLDGLPEETVTLVEAVKTAVPGAEILDTSDVLSDEMLMAAAQAEVVILAVGESNARNGEYNCVASLDLPAGQEALIEAVHGMGKPVVLIVFSGRPVNLTRSSRFVDAILFAWHPGSMGALAAADILFGTVTPSGKLPISYPRSEGQIPIHYNHKSTGRPAWSRYLDTQAVPLYPFGYGLSYTRFEYSEIEVDKPHIKPGDILTVSAVVKNVGRRPGDEVVQCYVQDCVASITRPVRELKGFARISLLPEESHRIRFHLSFDELSFYTQDKKRILEPGHFKVWIGGSSLAELVTEFDID
jgi:beta-glucosidase